MLLLLLSVLCRCCCCCAVVVGVRIIGQNPLESIMTVLVLVGALGSKQWLTPKLRPLIYEQAGLMHTIRVSLEREEEEVNLDSCSEFVSKNSI